MEKIGRRGVHGEWGDTRYESNTQAPFACLPSSSTSNNMIPVAHRDAKAIVDGYEILVVDAPDLGVIFSVAFDHAPSSKVSGSGFTSATPHRPSPLVTQPAGIGPTKAQDGGLAKA